MGAASVAPGVARRLAEAFGGSTVVRAGQTRRRAVRVGAVTVAAGPTVAARVAAEAGRVDASAAGSVAVAVDIRAGPRPGFGRRPARGGAGPVPTPGAPGARLTLGPATGGRAACKVAEARGREGFYPGVDTY